MQIFFLLMGVLMFVIWLFLRKKAHAAMQWPVTQGTVLTSELRTQQFGNDAAQDYAYVTYEYVVNGATLRGDQIALGGSGQKGAKGAVAFYRPGKAVEVFYDPQKPSKALLERKLSRNALVLPVVGTFFISMSLFLLAK